MTTAWAEARRLGIARSGRDGIKFATWNIELGASSQKATQRKLDKLRELRKSGCELIALQEVHIPNGLRTLQELRSSGDFPHLLHRLPQTPVGDLACAILATQRFDLVDNPENLTGLPAPERSCIVSLRLGYEVVTAASFHFVTGGRGGWGPLPKRQNFRAVASWLAKQGHRTMVGLDCNSPRVDHPDVKGNVYFKNKGINQEEYLLHDPSRAPHHLRDAYRRYLDDHPDERTGAERNFERVSQAHPEHGEGCLATSHVQHDTWERRFDYIYVTQDLSPIRVEYRSVEEAREAGSSHGIVVAELELA